MGRMVILEMSSLISKSSLSNKTLTSRKTLRSDDLNKGGIELGYYNYSEWVLNFDIYQILGKNYKWMDENPIQNNIWQDIHIWKD